LGKLSQLEYLYLFANALTGTIPSELGKLSQLKVLVLHDNNLNGIIPYEFTNLTNLIYLNLVGNDVTVDLDQLCEAIPNLLVNFTTNADMVLTHKCNSKPSKLLSLTPSLVLSTAPSVNLS